ncbi:MAG: threonine synthase [Candidatus Azotimanducaceae bacterium]|jgi:threonine synthase
MKYESTRGKVKGLSFKDAVIMGLASDGGLLLPESIPDVSQNIGNWREHSYEALAFEIMSLYIDDISDDNLKEIIDRSYASFDDAKVTPIRRLGDTYLLELFHGPTLAFKDVALQFLGNIFEHILTERGTTVNILGATSGDTGSAAISGIRGKENINIFIMFPEGKTSPVQERQMTSILDDNVHNIGINGSFDDCQLIMKSVFSDLEFKADYNLAAVNSVNWTRVLAQVVYYFSAYYQMKEPVQFDVCVPTGNFGNIFAGYIAKKMGLPIRRLNVATNANDILSRFFNTGAYERGEVNFTNSPAMDIQVASNFERYLFYKYGKDSDKLIAFFDQFLKSDKVEMNFNTEFLDDDIRSASVSNDDTIKTIKRIQEEYDYVVDPHTAVGLTVAAMAKEDDIPMLALSTAHPAKFEDVLALSGIAVSHPSLDALKGLPTKKLVIDVDIEKIKTLIREVV